MASHDNLRRFGPGSDSASLLRYLDELAADTVIGLSLLQLEGNAVDGARFLIKFSMSMDKRNKMESVSMSFQAHIGHRWTRCKDDEIIH